MSLKLLLAFTITELFVDLTPGPAVLLIISQGVRGGVKSSMRGILGIETVNALFFILSALGLGALLMASLKIFLIIKWVGAAYLIFIGIKMLFSAKHTLGAHQLEVRSTRSGTLYLHAVITQITNPKAILFFTALLPQFVIPRGDVLKQFVILGTVSILVEIPVLLSFGWLADRGGHLLPTRLAALPDRVAGLMLIGAGAGLASLKKS